MRTIFNIYVDDMVVTDDDPNEVSSLKAHQAREFEIKDLDPLRFRH